jgi:hypothetical protein
MDSTTAGTAIIGRFGKQSSKRPGRFRSPGDPERVIATSERLGVNRILTVDERDFRAVRGADGKPFRLLPADA